VAGWLVCFLAAWLAGCLLQLLLRFAVFPMILDLSALVASVRMPGPQIWQWKFKFEIFAILSMRKLKAET